MGGKLFISSGHYDNDPGAVANGYQENIETIELKRLIVEAIRQQDNSIEVITDDNRDKLSIVISKFKKLVNKESILLDIHFNAASSDQVEGCEVYVKKGSSDREKKLAQKIVDIVCAILGTNNRGVKIENQSQHNSLGILHTGAGISILLEVQFITAKIPMQYYQKWRHWLAWEIATILINAIK